MEKIIKKLTKDNLEDFSRLFSNDNCEKCQCTFYFSANNIDTWDKMSIDEAKKLRKNITDKCSDAYIYYKDNEPTAWCQCLYPKDAPYLEKLLNIGENENSKIISCFFIKKEYRGKGIQKEFLKYILLECKNEGIDSTIPYQYLMSFLIMLMIKLKMKNYIQATKNYLMNLVSLV